MNRSSNKLNETIDRICLKCFENNKYQVHELYARKKF